MQKLLDQVGFTRAGTITLVTNGRTNHWLTLAERPFYAAPIVYSSDGLHVQKSPGGEISLLISGLTSTVENLSSKEEYVALYGSGTAAEQLIQLVPSLAGLVRGVVDSDPCRHGKIFAPTGHTISSPEKWAECGASHLLYASKAYQEEMRQAHQSFGPPDSRGISLYPSVVISQIL